MVASSNGGMQSVIFSSARLKIRCWEETDAYALAEAGDSTRVAKWLTDAFPQPYTTQAAKDWINECRKDYEGTGWHFAIATPDGKSILGGIGIKPSSGIYARSKELGYWLRENAWGKGIMTDAVRGYVQWCFDEHVNVNRVWARVTAGNSASEAVLQKSDFVYEGTLRNMVWKHGRSYDENIWARLRPQTCERLQASEISIDTNTTVKLSGDAAANHTR